METFIKFLTPGILFGLTLVTGLWLSSLGKPYNGLAFNIHKLIALAGVVAAIYQFSKIAKQAPVQTLAWLLVGLAAVGVIALFATGALMSLGKLSYDLELLIHRVAPILAALALAGVVYLLANRAASLP